MNIHCNTGIDKTKTINGVDDLDRDTVCIHPSGLTKILSLSMIEKRFRITYDNHGSVRNAFIVHIGLGNGIHFRHSKRGLY